MPASAPRHSAVTLNVMGLSGSKLCTALTVMQQQAVHLGIFTETLSRESPETLLARTPGAAAVSSHWRFHHVPGTGHTGGVTIAIAASSPFSSFRPYVGLSGAHRVLRLDGQLDGSPASILGIYAPAQPPERRTFYASVLPAYFPQDGRLIIAGGDFNVTLSNDDIVGPDEAEAGARAAGRTALQGLMTQLSLKDVWRERAAPGQRAFTHWAATSGARLDFWLVSEPLLTSASSSILGSFGVSTDHSVVGLSLRSDEPRLSGKGLDGFPLLIFGVQPAFQELRQFVAVEAEKLMAAPVAGLVRKWSDFKERIRKKAHQLYAKHRGASLRHVKGKARVAAAAARGLAAAQGSSRAQKLQEWREAEAAAAAAWGEALRPVKEAAEVVDQAAGETSSYYFHSRVRVRPAPAHIEALNQPGRQPGAPANPAATHTAEGLGRALHYARDHFSSESPFGLFKQHDGVTDEAQAAMLGSLDRRLSADQAAMAEGPDGDGLLSGEEVQLAIESANRGSAPGWDGLPYEVYRVFAAELVPVLVRVFNAAFLDTLNHAPLAELLTGVICLLAKPGQSADELAGYRPITLLNCDVKLVMWILSNRLQLPLDYLIDIGQSAFLRSRDISDNIRYHLHLAARLSELGLPAWLLLVDMSKAYDSVARCWLRSSMVAMGFREAGAARWCRLLLDGSTCRVRINGFFSLEFPVENGLFQGSSLSCQEWVIVLQPLFSYLGSLQAQGSLPALGRISTLPLPAPEPVPLSVAARAVAPAAAAHADDTKLVVLHPDQDGPVILEAFALARAAGMPALNTSKTCLLPLFLGDAPAGAISLGEGSNGEQRHQPTGFRTLLPGHPPHRLLGVPFSADAGACTHNAYLNLHAKTIAAIKPWQAQQLTALGRAYVANQSLASKLIFQANFTDPGNSLPPVQRAITEFIIRAGTPEEETPYTHRSTLSQKVLMLRPAGGGLGAPNLELAAASMRAKPVWRALTFSAHPQVHLFRHEASGALTQPADAPAGLHVLVTRPALPVSFPEQATRSTQQACKAFQQLRVQRILKPSQQDFWSVMHELTFAGAESGEAPKLEQVATPEARQWLRLSQVRAAWLDREQLPPEERADLDTILEALQPEWRTTVQLQDSPEPEWACVSVAADNQRAVFQGPDLGTSTSGEVRLWELWPCGILVPLSFPVVPTSPSLLPALVAWRPKPRSAWTRAEIVAAAAQSLLPAAQRVGVREPRLVGVWRELQLDPRVFGVPACPGERECCLLSLSARRARLALAHHQLGSAAPGSAGFILGYKEEGAAFPSAWRRAPPSGDGSLALLPLGSLDRLGLPGVEERWRRSVLDLGRLQDDEPSDDDTSDPNGGWVDLQRQRPPRPSPADRAEARQEAGQAAAAEEAEEAAANLLPLPEGFAAAWQRLADPTIHRPFRVTAWMAMHARLGCRAFLAHVRSSQARRENVSAHGLGVSEAWARCQAPCCSGLPAPPLETISHALLLCPEVAPAIDWLRAVWAGLAQVDLVSVPSSVEVLLSDRLDSWPGAPASKSALRLWSRLRVATLGAIWQARCEREAGALQPGATLAGRAASLALASVQSGIRRDWARAAGAAAASDLPSMCAAWFRGFDCSISLQDFKDRWATPAYFCHVEEAEGLPPSLVVHLGGPACPALPL